MWATHEQSRLLLLSSSSRECLPVLILSCYQINAPKSSAICGLDRWRDAGCHVPHEKKGVAASTPQRLAPLLVTLTRLCQTPPSGRADGLNLLCTSTRRFSVHRAASRRNSAPVPRRVWAELLQNIAEPAAAQPGRMLPASRRLSAIFCMPSPGGGLPCLCPGRKT